MNFARRASILNFGLTDVHIRSIPSHNLETQAEQTAQVLEQFVDGMPFMNGYSSTVLEPALSIIAPDYPNVYWVSTMTKTDEKLALIREIVDAVPEIDIIHLLYQVFATRCQGPLGNVVHTPTFMKQAEKFCACLDLVSPEAQVMALSTTVSIDTLACHLLAVRIPQHHVSGVCSHSVFYSLCSLSPFTPRHRYLAGFQHL